MRLLSSTSPRCLVGPFGIAALLLAACVGDIGDRLPASGVDPDGSDPEPTGFEPGVPVTPVEPDTTPHLFYSIGATSTTLSELGTELYEKSADAVTHYVFADPARRAAFVGCAPAAPGDACVESFLGAFGRRA